MKILMFLGSVLRPKDVFTAIQVIGYCLLRDSRFEKAVMCFGNGDNGKGTFLKLIEALLGNYNVNHVTL